MQKISPEKVIALLYIIFAISVGISVVGVAVKIKSRWWAVILALVFIPTLWPLFAVFQFVFLLYALFCCVRLPIWMDHLIPWLIHALLSLGLGESKEETYLDPLI